MFYKGAAIRGPKKQPRSLTSLVSTPKKDAEAYDSVFGASDPLTPYSSDKRSNKDTNVMSEAVTPSLTSEFLTPKRNSVQKYTPHKRAPSKNVLRSSLNFLYERFGQLPPKPSSILDILSEAVETTGTGIGGMVSPPKKAASQSN